MLGNQKFKKNGLLVATNLPAVFFFSRFFSHFFFSLAQKFLVFSSRLGGVFQHKVFFFCQAFICFGRDLVVRAG